MMIRTAQGYSGGGRPPSAAPEEANVQWDVMVSITEAVARLGVTHRTLRFYEERGLVRSVRVNHGARIYDSENMDRLRFICQARAATLTVREIATVLEANGPNRERAVALGEQKLVEFELQRHRIKAALSALEHGANVRPADHGSTEIAAARPPFRTVRARQE